MVCGKCFKTFTSLFCSLWFFGSFFRKMYFPCLFHACYCLYTCNKFLLPVHAPTTVATEEFSRKIDEDYILTFNQGYSSWSIVLHVFSFSWSITWREGFYWGWLVRWGTLHPLWKEQATCWEGSLGVGQEFARSVNYTMRTFQLSTSSFF